MRVREVKKDDFVEWVRMRQYLWPNPSNDHESEVKNYFKGENRDIVITFVLEREKGKLGGFIEINKRSYAEGSKSFPVPYIEGWYIDPDIRGNGYGAQLVASAEGWAKENGFNEIASDSEIDNILSIKVHKALGFKEVERNVCFIKQLE